jgi:hypothetical protein
MIARPQHVVALRHPGSADDPLTFVLPRDWQGLANRPGTAGIAGVFQVEPSFFGAYRDVMRDNCGPAAAKLVRARRFGTFRAMETAAVLYHDPAPKIAWNQIHLCELETNDFPGLVV